jgi:hypothetical protein
MKRGTGLRPRTLLALAVAAGLAALIVYRLAHLGLGREAATGAVTSSGGFHGDHSADELVVVGHKKPHGRPRGQYGAGGSGVGRPKPNVKVHDRRRFRPPPPARPSAAGDGGVDGAAEQGGAA